MADLKKLAIKLGTEGPVKTLPTPRKIQILFGGEYIIQTTNASYVWEHPFYPQFYVPKTDLMEASKRGKSSIKEGDEIKTEDGTQVGTQLLLKAGGKSTDQIIAFSDTLTDKAESLKGMVKIDFASMDQWFEEDTPIHVHPKDPFKRVDILQSTRDVRVSIDGKQIAHTTTSMHLYETGLPVRFYIPLTSVDARVLRPSETKTKCPYKGEAEYYSVEVDGNLHEDIFWYYNRPTLESNKVEGLLCPYNERVDIELDGEKLERPKSIFKKPKDMKPPSAV